MEFNCPVCGKAMIEDKSHPFFAPQIGATVFRCSVNHALICVQILKGLGDGEMGNLTNES